MLINGKTLKGFSVHARDGDLGVVDELEAVIASNLFRAARLRQSVLTAAFRTVATPPDENIDSAIVGVG